MFKAKGTELYQRLGLESQVQGASPHQLIALLYNSATAQIEQALLAHSQGNVGARRKHVAKCLGVIGGLSESLNFDVESELPYNLHNLYLYMQGKLVQNQRQFSVTECEEILPLLETLSDGWAGISAKIG